MVNPQFWEVSVDPHDLDRFSAEQRLWYESDEERQIRYRREDRSDLLARKIRSIIDSELTPRQQDVIRLYFFHGKTQGEIAQIMGISRRVVAQHLFGICRRGQKVGGAIKRIKKVCAQRNMSP
jgi:RNA polymerase sigma factor (sigma-70 family)